MGRIKIRKIIFGALILAGLACAGAFFVNPNLANADSAEDPLRLAVGGRPLGLGRAFSGVGGDINSLFTNPAGLAEIKNRQFTGHAGRLANDTYSNMLGTTFLLGGGVVGLGYLDNYTNLTTSVGTISANYTDTNRIFLVSYSKPLKALIKRGLLKDVSVGATLKLFNRGRSGSGITNQSATVNDLDIGILYSPGGPVKAGMSIQDVLASNNQWTGGTLESFVAVGRAGVSVKLLGEGGLRQAGGQVLVMNLDGEFYPNQLNVIPILPHFGIEWSPLRFIDLRFGTGLNRTTIDANERAITTAGVGIRLGRFRFDYGREQYANAAGVENNFFSLTYGVIEEEGESLQARQAREKLEAEKKEEKRLAKLQQEELRRQLEAEKRETARVARLQQAEQRRQLAIERAQKESEEKARRETEKRELEAKSKAERERTAKELAEQRAKFFAGIGNAIGTAGQNVGQALGKTGENVAKGIGAAAQGVGSTIVGTGQNIGKGLGQTAKGLGTAGQAVGGALGTTGKNVAKGFGDAGQAIGGALGTTGKNVGKAVSNAGNALGLTGRNIGNAFANTGSALGNAFNNVGGGLREFILWDPTLPMVKVEPGQVKEGKRPEKRLEIFSKTADIFMDVIQGKKSIQELGKVLPQFAISVAILMLKIALFVFILIVIHFLFREWGKRINK